MRNRRTITVHTIGGTLCVLLAGGCQHSLTRTNSPAPPRDINAVLAGHDRELMAIPGVVGVYVGLMADDKTECLKVMLARPNPELERKLPRALEGHPVVVEVTGEIRPFKRPVPNQR